MQCNKCSGLAIYESYSEFSGFKCLNCGKRENVINKSDDNEFDRFMRTKNEPCYVMRPMFELIKYKKVIKRKKKCKPRRKYKPKISIKPIKRCEHCRSQFSTNSSVKRFCSDNCGHAAYQARKRMKLAERK